MSNETSAVDALAIPLVCEGVPADNEASLSERGGAARERGVPAQKTKVCPRRREARARIEEDASLENEPPAQARRALHRGA